MNTKTILFASLITAMILPFSGMNFDDIQEAFAMQHSMINKMHSDNMDSTEIIPKESNQIVRHNKATSFHPIHFEHSYNNEIPDRSHRHNLSLR